MLLPVLVLVLSLFGTVFTGDLESYTAATTHHDLHHHDHLHTADLHHDHIHTADLHHDHVHVPDLHHHHQTAGDLHVTDLHHHHHTAGELHSELHHHDVVQEHGDHLHHSHHDVVVATPHASGFWKKSFNWKPRWVKSWHEKKIYVPVWKHVWGPVQTTEWVPIPKPPPGWQKH
ncbi:histidine-rich protein PFHRP-II-like isoform X3 [Ochlerotatus camptorhynchus]